MSRVKMGLASVGLVCAFGAAIPIQAQAGTQSVAAAIKAQDQAIKNSADYKQLQHFNATTAAQAKALKSKVSALRTKLDHAATVVSDATATTPAEKQGQTDWVKGDKEQVTGFGQLETTINDVLGGNKSAAKTELVKALKTVKAGDLLESKADKLLGLPAAD